MNQYAPAEANVATQFVMRVKQAYQTGMLLRSTVLEETGFVGGKASFPVFGETEATRRQPGRDVTATADIQGSVEANVEDWNVPQYIPSEIIRKVQYKAIAAYSTRCVKAIGRKADDITLRAMDAGIDSLNVVEADVRNKGETGSGATGMNQGKILRAANFLNRSGVDPENRWLAITSTALEDLLGDERISSSDYNTMMPLREGKMGYYSGFNVIMIPERKVGGLPIVGTPTSTANRTMYAWHMDAIGCAISEDIRTEMNYIPEKTAYLVNAMYNAGAVVIDPAGLVSISSTEAYTAPVASVQS